jgi:manganese/zinc/iron transport system substrate-binding protein
MKVRSLIIILFASLLLFSCQEGKQQTESDSEIKIVCTTGMLGDLVQNLIGTQAEVISLMGPGVDPHLYKASQGDLKKLSEADIIIYNGLHLEGKMGEIFKKLSNRKTILVAADAIDQDLLINSSDFQGAYDPHIWFDLQLWKKVATHLAQELSEEKAFKADSIQYRLEQYAFKLDSLDEWVKEQILQIDSSKRVLITAHDAFGYFGKAYQIEVKGLQGISTVSEYGLKDVSNLVNFISERGIRSVFVESSVSDRALKAVVEGCKSKGHAVQIGGTLYSDAMGEAGSTEGNYLGMVQHNVNTVVEGLK